MSRWQLIARMQGSSQNAASMQGFDPALGVTAVSQILLEQQVADEAEEMDRQRARELEEKRLDKARARLAALRVKQRELEERLGPYTKLSVQRRVQAALEEVEQDAALVETEVAGIERRMQGGPEEAETEREFLMRTGQLTGFGTKGDWEEQEGVSHQLLRVPDGEAEVVDDGDLDIYQQRYAAWARARGGRDDGRNLPEYRRPHPATPSLALSPTYSLPGDLHPLLFPYQKTCVQWLYELREQATGGILGDEMGLGKTVQIVLFLAGLHHLGLWDKPAIVVCPATVLQQWVKEFHRWWPAFRVVVLHRIGSGFHKSELPSDHLDGYLLDLELATLLLAHQLAQSVVQHGHIVLTTYAGVHSYASWLTKIDFGYAVLDEGHRIRNPDLLVLLDCKRLRTRNRLILLGTPIQNNLVELWLLFDFACPGRLGTLPVFQLQFAVPILMGGYANATNVQVETAYQCAVALRDLVTPYLLRRAKKDVAQDLPEKLEMVLFCKLTEGQREHYRRFLNLAEMERISSGKRQMLYGIDILRKICNHPDLLLLSGTKARPDDYGNPVRLGKMQVVGSLLTQWQTQNRKALVFAQTRQMLDILELYVGHLGLVYLRMDGTTPVQQRQQLVEQFNTDPHIGVFVLTTKVGGLGVNLTGALRVIIYDPDWNPSTDLQARERAWRLGQKQDVEIYRLMVAGLIEEKIYHRQIFKQLLANKILKDPRQKRFFKTNELHDLFLLEEEESGEMVPHSDSSFHKVAATAGVLNMEEYRGDEGAGSGGIMEKVFDEEGEGELGVGGTGAAVEVAQREARMVASEAVAAVKKLRRETRRARVGVPTWTGRHGRAGRVAGAAGESAGNAAGQTVLARSRVSTPSASTPVSRSVFGRVGAPPPRIPAAPRPGLEGVDEASVVAKMKAFLVARPHGFGTSQEVLGAVGVKMTGHADATAVRRMLHQVADWDRQRLGWVLRQ